MEGNLPDEEKEEAERHHGRSKEQEPQLWVQIKQRGLGGGRPQLAAGPRAPGAGAAQVQEVQEEEEGTRVGRKEPDFTLNVTRKGAKYKHQRSKTSINTSFSSIVNVQIEGALPEKSGRASTIKQFFDPLPSGNECR